MTPCPLSVYVQGVDEYVVKDEGLCILVVLVRCDVWVHVDRLVVLFRRDVWVHVDRLVVWITRVMCAWM